jgi:hypothetical protein
MCEAERGGALVVDQTRTEYECEQPENHNEKHLDHGYQNEEHDIDWYGELKSVNKIEVGQRLVIQIQHIDRVISLLVIGVVPEIYIGLSYSLDIFTLLVIVDVYFHLVRESCSMTVRVECDRQKLIATVIDQGRISSLVRLSYNIIKGQ